MVVGFRDVAPRDLRNGKNSKAARTRLPRELWVAVARKLGLLHGVLQLDELKVPPGNKLEALKGDRGGQHSIRIDQQYRVCFVWTDEGVVDVEVADNH